MKTAKPIKSPSAEHRVEALVRIPESVLEKCIHAVHHGFGQISDVFEAAKFIHRMSGFPDCDVRTTIAGHSIVVPAAMARRGSRGVQDYEAQLSRMKRDR